MCWLVWCLLDALVLYMRDWSWICYGVWYLIWCLIWYLVSVVEYLVTDLICCLVSTCWSGVVCGVWSNILPGAWYLIWCLATRSGLVSGI